MSTVAQVKTTIEAGLSDYAARNGYCERIRPSTENIIQRDYWKDLKEIRYVLIEITPRDPEGNQFTIQYDQLPPEEKTRSWGASVFDSNLWRHRAEKFCAMLIGPLRTRKMKPEPNKAMEPMRILVTDRANARSAPSIRMAHLGR